MNLKVPVLITVILMNITILGLFSCDAKATNTTSKHQNSSQSTENLEKSKDQNMPSEKRMVITKKKIGLALGKFGLGDQSFNDMQYNGVVKASAEHNLDVVYKVPAEDDIPSYTKILNDLIEVDKVDILIAGEGFKMAEIINQLALKHPKVYFIIMDFYGNKLPNIIGTSFAQNEGSYLIGITAAMMTKTNKVGFIGGVDIPVVKAFLLGFEAGVKYINPQLQVEAEYITKLPDFGGFSDPKKGNQMATNMYMNKNIDIIYSVAGASGNGIIQSAQEMKKYVFGVDSDQDHMAPGFVLTSMMKRLDIAVEDLVKKYIANNLKGGIYHYNIKNHGISLSPMKFTKDKIPQDVLKKLEDAKQKIATGEIKVPDTLEASAKGQEA